MASTHTRPPTHRGGRPPKGPRPVATAREKLLADLHAASAHLRAHDAPHLADTVDGLLRPGGWGKLRNATDAPGGDTETINIPRADREHYAAAAEAAGSTMNADVLEGLRAFTEGTFSPAGYPRRSPTTDRVTTSVRIPDDVRTAFAAAATARTGEIGYTPKLGHVAKAYLAHKYPRPAK